MTQAIDDAWASYARMVVEIERSGEPIVVHAAPLGEVGPWPWRSPEPVCILTAWDPGPSRPGVVANRREQARLEEDIRPLATAMWTARRRRSRDRCTRRGRGRASGSPRRRRVALGARYGQDAIFTWTPLEWAIVSCTGARRQVTGWALGPLS